jgi:hypothetical protein
LRNRFVVGAANNPGTWYEVGDTGGSADATLVSHSHTVNNHSHSFSGSTNSAGNHNHSLNLYTATDDNSYIVGAERCTDASSQGSTSTGNAGNHSHSVSGTIGNSSPGTNSQGSSATNANLPPYYALCYIMKT